MQSMGDYLRKKRRSKGMTQKQLAEKLGYATAQFVSIWERGESLPPVNKLNEISIFLGISKEKMISMYLHAFKMKLEKQFK